LLSKLNFYGIQGMAAEWFRSYLAGRKTKGKKKSFSNTQNVFSNWGTIKHGVSQASILGPVLFITYINDLPPKINSSAHPIIYADDSSVTISTKKSDNFCIALSYE
jgi:hypothetical protein